MPNNKRLLVCDLDNTLYDWVRYFVLSFYSMVDEVVRLTGCDREQLLDDFRLVHQQHSDSEHPFALLETETIWRIFPGLSRKDVMVELNSAFHAFNKSRKENLRLYPGVEDTLRYLSNSEIVLVAHTESRLYAAVDRLTRLGLIRYFRRVYCRSRSQTSHPDPQVGEDWLSRVPMEKIRELSHHQRKPNPEVLLEICKDEGIDRSATVYVGDSLARDILMAEDAGVFSAWAQYGAAHGREEYEKLVRVTHWSAEDVIRERELSRRVEGEGIAPSLILRHGFSEILPVFEAQSFVTAARR